MAIKKTSYSKIILLVCLFQLVLTNILKASHETGSARLSSPNITLNNTLFIQDNKYPSIVNMANINTWGFYDVSFKNKIILGIDRYSTLVIPDFVATVTVQIVSVVPQALGGTSTTITKTLSVSYEGKNDHQSSSSHASINNDVFTYNDGYASLAKITGISVSVSGGAPTTTMPSNVYLQLETDAERFYTLSQNSSPFSVSSNVTINYISTSDEFEISWTRINGAEEYDLEWLWLDYEKNNYWVNNPQIDFRNNSTRIRTSQQSYRISNIFDKGHVFLRIRGVGKSGLSQNTYDLDATSLWSWPDLTNIPTTSFSSPLSVSNTYGNDFLYFFNVDDISIFSHEANKNWQYKATYAEEGKKKEVISYFDGTLRSRQSVTKNNSDNNVIVGETYYDYNGRAAVQALPVPLPDSKIKFYQENISGNSGFNFDQNSLLPYDKKFFDLDATTTCGVVANGLNSSHGSSKYYSPNNINQQWAQGYVPNAENFPISQTEYTNDNTGRIAKQGGVGKTHQLGSNHETKYFYGSPEQIELDRLFGSEVGYNRHYKKNMVVDANGQVSISYLDQEGRTVATALSGQGPSSLTSLKDAEGNNLYSAPTATNVINADLLNKVNSTDFDTNEDNNERVGDELIFLKKIVVPTAGTYTVSYDLQGTSFTYTCLPENTCYDCVYDLEIDIYDDCLNRPAGFTPITKTLGKIIAPTSQGENPISENILNTNCDQQVMFSTSLLNYQGNDLNVSLLQGNYTITKKLKINKAAMTYYLEEYLKSDCVKEQADFLTGQQADISGCSLTCDECVAALGTPATYTASGKGTEEDYWREYKICREPCEFESMCEVEYMTMLTDVSPGGQYGDWEDGNGDCNVSLHNLSVFNENNLLPKIKTFTFSTLPYSDWKHPMHRTSVYSGTVSTAFTNKYYDENGNVAKVFVTQISSSPLIYSPPITPTANPIAVLGSSNQFMVEPQELANVSDFISRWQNSWATSLVFYHPEYAYYDWCLKNSTKKLTNPYSVSVNNGTVSVTNTISTSDDYDSLLMVTDDVIGLASLDLSKLANPLTYDPYWQTNGFYYKNGTAATQTVGATVSQLSNASALTYPWNTQFKSANDRYINYQGQSGLSLPVFSALITTSCVIQYGQSISTQINCLVPILNSTPGTLITPSSLSSMTTDAILLRMPSNLQNKYWANFKMMYLALKQEMQQEAAESYAMNGDYRGCNDAIGDPSFDPWSFSVPFTHYIIFGPSAPLYDYFDQWFFPFHSPNVPHYSNLFWGNYGNKIRRFPKAKNATDLSNSLNAGDPGASIYASTGLCPNAFYFQGLINALGTNNQLNNSSINLSTVPEFNPDLYKVVNNGVVPSTYLQANWTNTGLTANSISAYMQVGSNTPCPLTLTFPTGYPFNFSNTGNGGTYAYLRIYHLVPTTSSGGVYNFTMEADITLTSGGALTFTTVTLSGSTCIPLTGCNFVPPCAPTTGAIALQKLLNAIASTGDFCNMSPSTPISMSDPIIQPYFLNSFGILLGSGNWQWSVNGALPNFIIKDVSLTNPNKIEISLNTVPCPASGNTFAFSNITGNAVANNGFNIIVKTVDPSGMIPVSTSTTSGTVLINGQPFKMGVCGFDNVKCTSVPHQTKDELEEFLLSANTPAFLKASNGIISVNTKFGINLRNNLADNYQTFTSGSPNTTNQLYYYWDNTTAAGTSTALVGSFYVSTLTPQPNNPPSSACTFSLEFEDPDSAVTNGHSLTTGVYTLSNFTLAAGPMVNMNVYNFSVTATFASTTYTLLGTSSCFAMRACSECSTPPSSAGLHPPQTFTVNNYDCSGAPSFTISENIGGATTYYANTTNSCASSTLNPSVAYVLSQQAVYTDNGGHVEFTWTGYNGGSSLFIRRANGNEFAVKQDRPFSSDCHDFEVRFKLHNHGTPNGSGIYTQVYSANDFSVNINNGPALSFIGTNATADPNWTEYRFGIATNTNGAVNMIKIYGFNNTSESYIALDELKIVTLECPTGEGSLPCVNAETYPLFPEVTYEDPCVPYAQDLLENNAQELYSVYIDSVKNSFIEEYIKKCMGSAVENMYMKYNAGDYHFTLYYYDQAGNLVRTVPPEGVNVETNTTALNTIKAERAAANAPSFVKTYFTTHTLQTTYTYNALNQLVKQETPDAGISRFWYDALGRLIASQNAEQMFKSTSNTNYYSYTHYDYLGRISEVGQMIIPYDFANMTQSAIATWVNASNYPDNMASSKTEVTRTYYGDDANFTSLIAGSNFTSGSQEYLRSRVTSVTIEDVDDANSNTYNHGTHYSYDIHGNVKELIQENKTMVSIYPNHQFKKLNYKYDLVSGKVNQVDYQPGEADMFIHKYEYDADNRITSVYTSKDDVIWDRDAKYFYYLHGPLARVEIGHDKVQATDYAYTLQGWIKGVNSNILTENNDIGKDGLGSLSSVTTGNAYINKYNGRDVSAYSLTYFNNTISKDYAAINGTTGTLNGFMAAEPTSGITPDLFNGNIRQMVTASLDGSAPAKNYTPLASLRNYTYDQLNRIISANDNGNLNVGLNAFQNPTVTDLYKEDFVYDQNGNIKFVQRKGSQSGSLAMDDLTYHYITNTNKLAYVTDAVTTDPYSEDISSQSTGNYTYDKIGNLIGDVAENILNIEWTVYGKIKHIYPTANSGKAEIIFNYDASGNRISKTTFYPQQNPTNEKTTYYVRDAQGNVMATYEAVGPNNGTYYLTLKEQHIYGSSRIGMMAQNALLSPPPIVTNGNYTRTLGLKSYELSNHLGNVLTVVSDRKILVETTTGSGVADHFITDIISATDYYSFGSPMPGRHYTNANGYRYGFNGKENDNEVVGTGEGTQDYGLRIYNPALGKFLSIDPLTKEYPYKSPYDFAENTPIIGSDLDGAELQIDILGNKHYGPIDINQVNSEILKKNPEARQNSAMGEIKTGEVVKTAANFGGMGATILKGYSVSMNNKLQLSQAGKATKVSNGATKVKSTLKQLEKGTESKALGKASAKLNAVPFIIDGVNYFTAENEQEKEAAIKETKKDGVSLFIGFVLGRINPLLGVPYSIIDTYKDDPEVEINIKQQLKQKSENGDYKDYDAYMDYLESHPGTSERKSDEPLQLEFKQASPKQP